MAIIAIANAIRKIVKDEPFHPKEYIKLDRLGNQNGHPDLEDIQIIATDAFEEIVDIGSKVVEVAGNAIEAVGDFVGDALDFLGDLF